MSVSQAVVCVLAAAVVFFLGQPSYCLLLPNMHIRTHTHTDFDAVNLRQVAAMVATLFLLSFSRFELKKRL